MQVVVTGATNPFGKAIVETLANAGHHVRAFGVEPGDGLFEGMENVQRHPGRIDVTGSIEPVLVQREALVHAAGLDAPGKDRRAHAFKIERGALSARYGAEREMVDHFLHLSPVSPDRRFAGALERAEEEARRTRGAVNVHVVPADDPEATAKRVLESLAELPRLGFIPGANDAVTA